MHEEPLIYREEVRAIIGALADLVVDIHAIFVNGWKGAMGKKETRQEKIERIRREAEDRPIVRELRELAAGRAERDYRRKKALEGG